MTILDYPQAWQNLINSAGLQLLNDMLFAHPFPIGHDGCELAHCQDVVGSGPICWFICVHKSDVGQTRLVDILRVRE